MRQFFPKHLLSLAVACLSLAGQAQVVSKNVTLLGQLAYPPSSTNLAGVWSYAAAGKEYALVGVFDGLSIVDVTTPAAPAELFHLTHTPPVHTMWHEIKTWSHYAYVTNEAGDGLRIVNLQYLPDSVQYKDVVLDSMPTAHTLTIDEKGYLYINGGTYPRQGMGIFDLNPDPWNPVKVGEWHDRYIHDQYVRNDTAYTGEILDGLLEIIDLTDRANPVVVGSTSYLNSFTHNTWLNDAGNVCFTTDETYEAFIYSWDVSDPGNITQLDGIRSSTGNYEGIPHNVQVKDDFLVTAYYMDGLHIVDAARPHNLIEVGYYDHYPSGATFAGFWGADPFLPSGTVLCADMDSGLYVFQVDYRRGCYLEGTVTDSVTGLPISGVEVSLGASFASDFSNGDGFYATGVADSGMVTVTYSAFGYRTKTVSYVLDNGVVTVGDVALAPIGRTDLSIRVVDEVSGLPIPGAKVRLHETTMEVNTAFTADAAGEVHQPLFISSTYDVYAGIWGHVTKLETHLVDSATGTITLALARGYADNFCVDLGWVAQPKAEGEWQRGEPIGTYAGPTTIVNPENDTPADVGADCYVTENAAVVPDLGDVDGGESILTSPVMDLSTMVKPVLRHHRYFYNQGGGGAPLDDTLRIEITNGADTHVLRKVTGFTSDFWKLDTFDLKALLPPGFLNSTVQVRYICGDYGTDHLVEGGLDNFILQDQAPVAVEKPQSMGAAQMEVWPNPTGELAQMRALLTGISPHAEVEFELSDLSGKTLASRTFAASPMLQWELPMPYPQGVYFGTLRCNGEVLRVVKVVK